MVEWLIERINERHERNAFTCGRSSLDAFIRRHAGQYDRKGIGRTFVARRPHQARIAGFYTLAAGSLELTSFPADISKKLPRHPVPVAHLGRFAVEKGTQGQGLGGLLLHDALRRCLLVSEQLALFAVELYALDSNACQFYTHYGFAALLDDLSHMFLRMTTVTKMFPDEAGKVRE